MCEHYTLAEQLYDPKRCGQLMRKFGIKYSRLHPQHSEVRSEFAQIHCRQDWQAVLDKWYREDLPGQYPTVDE